MEVEESLGSTQLKQILDSFEAGDVLPEADIVCNIVDKLGKNIVICSCLLQYCSLSQDDNLNHFLTVRRDNHSASLNSALQIMTSLYQGLTRAEAGLDREEDDLYNGDADAEDPKDGDKKRKKKTGVFKKKQTVAVKLVGDEKGDKSARLQFLVRDVIFYLVKEYGTELTSVLDTADKDAASSQLEIQYTGFKEHARPLVARSHEVTTKEHKILVEKILSRQRLEKVNMVKEKEREGNELKFSIAESNEESQANIEMKRRATQTNIMQIDWESTQKQTEMKEKILLLLGEHKDLCGLHWRVEREARRRNLELEAGVKALLEKYDQEMFDFHNKIEALEEEWGQEKQQLAKVETRLTVIGAERDVIVREMEEEEARVRNLRLEEIQRRRAAITIQRGWRQHKVLQQQSKKKKKGKKK